VLAVTEKEKNPTVLKTTMEGVEAVS